MKDMIFEKKYKYFDEFFEDAQESIYKRIIETLKTINSKENVTFKVSADVDNTKFDHEFILNKTKGLELIQKTLLPYFESIEDYDYCFEIMELQKKLTGYY